MNDPRLLYLNPTSRSFAGFNKEKSIFTIIGIPMDITSSFRPGSRFAPSAIRDAATNIEFYSLRTGIDMGDVGFNDVGDIALHPSDVEENVKRIKDVISFFSDQGKIPISIGGEHSITIGTVLGTKADCVISFDAHLDLRDDYLGYKYDHACVMRRLSENGIKIMEIGNRAVSKEELEYSREAGIPFITSNMVQMLGAREVARKIINFTSECRRIYITYDTDSIDPSYAPGVATPEPEGLSPSTILDIVNLIIDKRIVGFDIVEITPSYDPSGITSILGAKMIMETAAIIKSKLP
ncbi:agmatinase [Acidianus sulfidivorans JP7]|uniref:Agmatinase n=1 Tax=Acidianus sulfidivorans JP7 TaxID=619593 RepID=A0A2U9IM45_9CREN|nr:agmatinase [Acidianus sulfidivorans]AWR97139.1 agmatinase [Acidianus sulfidivorans JP7]